MIMENTMYYTEWEKKINKQIAGYELTLRYKSLGVVMQRNRCFDQQA